MFLRLTFLIALYLLLSTSLVVGSPATEKATTDADDTQSRLIKHMLLTKTRASKVAQKAITMYSDKHGVSKKEVMKAVGGAGPRQLVADMLPVRKSLIRMFRLDDSQKKTFGKSNIDLNKFNVIRSSLSSAGQIPSVDRRRNGARASGMHQSTKLVRRRKELIEAKRNGQISDNDLRKTLVELGNAHKDGTLRQSRKDDPRMLVRTQPLSKVGADRKRKDLIEMRKRNKISQIDLKRAIADIRVVKKRSTSSVPYMPKLRSAARVTQQTTKGETRAPIHLNLDKVQPEVGFL